MDIIVFSVGNNYYALNIENIQRIIQAKELTTVPNAHALIDGMMNYESNVIKVLNFRKLIGLPAYEKDLYELFIKFKSNHQTLMNELKNSIENGTTFTKPTDLYKCELGIWLNNFNSYDDGVSTILKSLIEKHRYFHIRSSELLELSKSDKNKAVELLKTDMQNILNLLIKDMDIFIAQLEIVANSLQKLLIYEKDNIRFAIKVDFIEDIVDVDETMIIYSGEDIGETQLLGILDIKGVLVNIIKDIKLPSKGDKYGN